MERLVEKRIGERIKQLRRSRGFSQIELAERMGISFQQIQKYEKGLTRISVARLNQISETLGARVTDFLKEEAGLPGISEPGLKYSRRQDFSGHYFPLNKEEISLLKLFRKVRNKKIREGVLRQLRGVVEVERQDKQQST